MKINSGNVSKNAVLSFYSQIKKMKNKKKKTLKPGK